MKHLHQEEEHEKDNSERWLLTYSDLITLLLALFIIMYSMSTIDLQKMKELSAGLSEAFNNSKPSVSQGSGVGTGENEGSKSDSSSSSSGEASEEGIIPTEIGPLDQIYKELSEYIEANQLQDKINLENTDTYVKIRLKDTILFVPDSPVMLDKSKPILNNIADILNKIYDKIDHITITGHTADPTGVSDKVSSDFAWELSVGRATTVLNFMTSCGLPEYKLSIEGYSHFKPIADNKTKEGMAQNRRVEITIFKN